MTFLLEAMRDGAHGNASAKRVAIVVGSFALSVSVVLLAVASCFGVATSDALWAVSTSLAALSGASYVGGKVAEK